MSGEEKTSSNATVPLLDDDRLEAQPRNARKAVSLRPEDVNSSLKGLRWIIFPDNRLAQVWDMIMIVAIWFYAFALPFQMGISGGYFIVVSHKRRGHAHTAELNFVSRFVDATTSITRATMRFKLQSMPSSSSMYGSRSFEHSKIRTASLCTV